MIDFSQWAGKTLYLENRLNQSDGKGPDANLGLPGVAAPRRGRATSSCSSASAPARWTTAASTWKPARTSPYYALPSRPLPRISRSFRFERELDNGW